MTSVPPFWASSADVKLILTWNFPHVLKAVWYWSLEHLKKVMEGAEEARKACTGLETGEKDFAPRPRNGIVVSTNRQLRSSGPFPISAAQRSHVSMCYVIKTAWSWKSGFHFFVGKCQRTIQPEADVILYHPFEKIILRQVRQHKNEKRARKREMSRTIMQYE